MRPVHSPQSTGKKKLPALTLLFHAMLKPAQAASSSEKSRDGVRKNQSP
jgi:hypothetical protein